MVLSIIQSKFNDVIHKIMNDTLNKCWAMTDNCFILKWFMFVSDEKEVVYDIYSSNKLFKINFNKIKK